MEEFARQTGAEWTVSYTSLEDLRKAEQDAWESGNPRATGYTLRRIWAEGGTLYESRDNEAIGFTQPATLADAVAESIKAQK